MLNTPVSKNALAPLLLRLALAVVFIYHGVDKIFGPINKWGQNDWGTTWATHLWERMGQPPEDLKSKARHVYKDDDSKRIRADHMLGDLYREEGKKELPSAIAFTGGQFAVAWGELLGGIAMLFGFLTRLAALGLVIIQIGAIATVTAFKGFYQEAGGGYEFNLVLVAACLSLLLMGGGMLSIDHWFASRREQKAQEKALTTQPPMTSPAATGV